MTPRHIFAGEEMAERFRDPPTENLEILERVAKGNLFWAESGGDWKKLRAACRPRA